MTQPRVTLAMPCYRQARFVREALQGAFAQTYRPLELLVIDDASGDETPDVIEACLADAPDTLEVRFLRNEVNQGVEVYNTIADQARGDLIVMAHSDDVSAPARVRLLVEAWQDTGASLVSSNAVRMDANGQRRGLLVESGESAWVTAEEYAESGYQRRMHGATLAFSRKLFAQFGGLSQEFSAISTDWVLPFRAALSNGAFFLNRKLVLVREHGKSRYRRFTVDQDRLVGRERHLALETIQYRYMLHTLKDFVQHGDANDDLKDLERRLMRGALYSALNWAGARNKLMSRGLRPEWTDVKSDF